jgi:hypothetical protein
MTFVIIAILGILGAALIVGGIVGYRKSVSPGIKTLAAASIAAGVVMWALILLTMPASVSYGS